MNNQLQELMTITMEECGELIQECIVAMEFGGAAEDIARTCHGHPGLSEVVKEAALDVDGRALHS